MDLEDMIAAVPLVGSVKQSDIPTPEEYDYWDGREKRIFFIDYELDDSYELIELAKTIIKINFDDSLIPVNERKPITIFIFSYGGDSNQASFFSDLLISSKTPVVTVATGVAMSAAFEIFLAGKKRYAFEHTQMLVHSGSASFKGTAEQIEDAQKNYKKMLDRSKDYVLERTSIDEKTFNKNRNKDWYLTKEDFIKYHIVDKIVTCLDEVFEPAAFE